MPCDQIRLQSVDFANGNVGVLKAALEAAGYEVSHDAERNWLWFRDKSGTRAYRTGTFRNGTFTVQEGIDVDEIKKEYANEAVKVAAKKFNWSVKETAENKFRLTRRTF